jgi:hypothetical protein
VLSFIFIRNQSLSRVITLNGSIPTMRLYRYLFPVPLLRFRSFTSASSNPTQAANQQNGPKPSRRKPRDRPNFILLFMDDLGYGDLGFTGHPTTDTPNLDRLAWNGMVLTTWYSACAACTVRLSTNYIKLSNWFSSSFC